MLRSTRSATLGAIVAILALGAVTACSSNNNDDNAERGPTVYTRSGATISARVGEEFVILLEANPTTGFEWTVTETVPEIRLVSNRYDPPAEQIPGRGGHQEFRFEARAPGRATLELTYARAFEPDVPPAETATFDLRIDSR